jgi:hypothetical protein
VPGKITAAIARHLAVSARFTSFRTERIGARLAAKHVTWIPRDRPLPDAGMSLTEMDPGSETGGDARVLLL